jgi:hypothetical protein
MWDSDGKRTPKVSRKKDQEGKETDDDGQQQRTHRD